MFDLPMASVHAFILTVYSVVAPDYNSAALRDGWSWICCGEQVHGRPRRPWVGAEAAGFNRLSHQEIKTSASVCFTPSLVCGEKTKRACL